MRSTGQRAMNFIQTKDDLIRKLEKDHDRAEDALFSLLPREKRSALEVRFHDLPPINQKLGEAEDSVCVALFGAWKRNALAKVLATATILPPNATAGRIAFFRASFRQESRFALGPS